MCYVILNIDVINDKMERMREKSRERERERVRNRAREIDRA